MYVYIYIWGSYNLIYIYYNVRIVQTWVLVRVYISIHVQQKPVFLYINLGRNCHKNTNQHLASSASTTRTATPPEQDTVGSIATHTKGGKESSQNEPGEVPATYRRGGGFQRLSSCAFFRLFMKNLVKFSQWRPCVVSFVESLGICCWNQKHREKRKRTQHIIIWDDLKTYLFFHFLKSHPTMSRSFTTVAIHLPRCIALCKSFGKCPGCLGRKTDGFFSNGQCRWNIDHF